jgi:hypothetical protein
VIGSRPELGDQDTSGTRCLGFNILEVGHCVLRSVTNDENVVNMGAVWYMYIISFPLPWLLEVYSLPAFETYSGWSLRMVQ